MKLQNTKAFVCGSFLLALTMLTVHSAMADLINFDSTTVGGYSAVNGNYQYTFSAVGGSTVSVELQGYNQNFISHHNDNALLEQSGAGYTYGAGNLLHSIGMNSGYGDPNTIESNFITHSAREFLSVNLYGSLPLRITKLEVGALAAGSEVDIGDPGLGPLGRLIVDPTGTSATWSGAGAGTVTLDNSGAAPMWVITGSALFTSPLSHFQWYGDSSTFVGFSGSTDAVPEPGMVGLWLVGGLVVWRYGSGVRGRRKAAREQTAS